MPHKPRTVEFHVDGVVLPVHEVESFGNAIALHLVGEPFMKPYQPGDTIDVADLGVKWYSRDGEVTTEGIIVRVVRDVRPDYPPSVKLTIKPPPGYGRNW